MDSKFATSLSCIDGRIQIPINSWIKEHFKVDYVDTITEPGIDKIEEPTNVEKIKHKVNISLKAHKSQIIAISGHYQCAANPGDKTSHIPQIEKWIKKINSWKFNVPVVGLWINDKWEVEKIF